MTSLNLDNLQQAPNWTCNGFLFGRNLLSDQLFNDLITFDYSLLPQIGSPTGQLKRNCLTCNGHHNEGNAQILYDVVKPLTTFLSETEVLLSLIDRGFENPGIWSLERFWSCGKDSIRRLYTGGWVCHLNEDYEGFSLSPHMDHHECVAFIHIFLSPEGYNVGTVFHDPHNLSDIRKVPFEPNAGYFVTNTYRAMHSVLNDQPIKRRSLIFGWIL